MTPIRRTFAVTLLLGTAALGRTIDVSPKGSDKNDGSEAAPLATCAWAVALAKPGDTIRLDLQAVYRDGFKLKDVAATADAPLMIDGRGATLDGADPLDPADWTEHDGLFESKTFYAKAKITDTKLPRWFFLFDGKAQRMGHSVKGPKAEYKTPAALAEGEWTVQDQVFYLKPPAGMPLAKVAYPARESGVAIAGKSTFVVIKNLSVRHVWNDGFNIHGQSTDIRFEAIESTECGDDGLSAHEDCRVAVDGFVASRNGTGVCQVNRVVSTMRNAKFVDNVAYDYGGLHATQNTLDHCTIARTVGGTAVTVGSGNEQTATLTLKDVEFAATGDARTQLTVRKNSTLTADHAKVTGMSVRVDGAATVRDSAFAGGWRISLIVTPGATWAGSGNAYDIGPITLNGQRLKSPDALDGATAPKTAD